MTLSPLTVHAVQFSGETPLNFIPLFPEKIHNRARSAVSIYKPCDIRGEVAEELTPNMYRSWGTALGLQVKPVAKFVVGGDVRASTPDYLEALIDGLADTGVDVINLGQLPTPMIYHAKRRLQAAACAIVTASHNPAFVNGLKWLIGNRPPTPADVEAMRRPPDSTSHRDRTRREPRTLDISFDYVANLQETWLEAMDAQLHLVIDPMHGCWAARARKYLHAIFPQCLFTTIHDAPEDDFAGNAPDCSQAPLLHELGEAVYRERAHAGLAFDGDGDRLAVVDENGAPLSGEETTWILLDNFGEAISGRRFVHDLKFSARLIEHARKLGAEPVAERSGHAFIRAKMAESEALFGAEVSGHYFFESLDGGDDGFYTACRLIAHLARSGKPLSKLRKKCPTIYITPDLRVFVPREAQADILAGVRAAWDSFEQTTIDGVRIDTPSGWILARPSVTEEVLTFRFESIDWPSLDDLVERFAHTLPEELCEELMSQYGMALGRE
jgi:phosphomannomutase